MKEAVAVFLAFSLTALGVLFVPGSVELARYAWDAGDRRTAAVYGCIVAWYALFCASVMYLLGRSAA